MYLYRDSAMSKISASSVRINVLTLPQVDYLTLIFYLSIADTRLWQVYLHCLRLRISS